MKWCVYRMSIDFVSLAVCTSLNIVFDLLTHPRPPVVVQDKLDGVINTWMPIDWWVVVHLDQCPLVVESSSDYLLSILVPCVLDFLKSMGVDPEFQCILVLFIYWVFDCHLICRDDTVGWGASSVDNGFGVSTYKYSAW